VESKTCNICLETKPIEEFRKHPTCKGGRLHRCRTCASKKEVECRRDAWKKSGIPDHVKNRVFLKLYGITLETYNKMLAEQNYTCALCPGTYGRKEGEGLQVDHDHVTGKIRGLLCGLCNKGLGMFKDDPDLLERAANYVRKG
jgi:hypothetical protein